MSQIKEIELIPYGKENRISKKELANRLKIKTEEVNQVISKLRKYYIISSDCNTGGYWRPNTEKELLDFIKERNRRQYTETEVIQIAWDEIEKFKGEK